MESSGVLASNEVHDLAVAIGCDPGTDNIDGLRYGKVIILADADSDGLHIATLLAALFLRHFPALVRAGNIFVAMPPLFRVDVGKQVFYALDEEEKRILLDRIEKEKIRGQVNVTRFKGLGEMNPVQLRESTIHPDTRRLVQLTVDDADLTRSLMDMLLAKKRAGDRKAWLEAKGDLASLEVGPADSGLRRWPYRPMRLRANAGSRSCPRAVPGAWAARRTARSVPSQDTCKPTVDVALRETQPDAFGAWRDPRNLSRCVIPVSFRPQQGSGQGSEELPRSRATR